MLGVIERPSIQACEVVSTSAQVLYLIAQVFVPHLEEALVTVGVIKAHSTMELRASLIS